MTRMYNKSTLQYFEVRVLYEITNTRVCTPQKSNLVYYKLQYTTTLWPEFMKCISNGIPFKREALVVGFFHGLLQ